VKRDGRRPEILDRDEWKCSKGGRGGSRRNMGGLPDLAGGFVLAVLVGVGSDLCQKDDKEEGQREGQRSGRIPGFALSLSHSDFESSVLHLDANCEPRLPLAATAPTFSIVPRALGRPAFARTKIT